VSCETLQPLVGELSRAVLEEPASAIPTELEMGNGLKEALIKGTKEGVAKLGKEGGFLDNPAVRIPFPEEYEKVANTLRDIGLGGQIDQVETTLNRAAEDAVIEASPLFVNAITSMTIADAQNILFGDKNAATQYLQSKTTAELVAKFSPKISASLDKVNATKYWSDVTDIYNKIPFVTKVNGDLTNYATNKTIDGLFLNIAKEEEAIRENPLERTTSILKKVFDYAASKAE
jgi:hypothetical protein